MNTDVLVIGGGATGGGIALDLALRGARVILVEMGDLATGTSGRYHGLLHSGARYAVRDSESAQECIDENRILRRIAAPSIEATGGYFVLCPGDDSAYIDRWLQACAAVDIPTRAVSLNEARKREPALNPKLEAVYEVPDGTCDSWDLLHQIQMAAQAIGAQFLTYHRVEAMYKSGDQIVGARVRNLRTDKTFDIDSAIVINAAGPWAAEVAEHAGATFGMRLSRGAMLAYNIRWVNTVINKLRMPGDGDIFVPVGTVSVIGTTSVPTDDPNDTRVERWEVTRILDEAEAMTPGISRARILRAWGGVRPLYDPGGDQRDARRTFAVLDHGERDGVNGIISVVGGKLTTYRLMAEKAADLAAHYLGIERASVTADTVLPSPHGESKIHTLPNRLDHLEHGENPGALICECEIVTAPQIRAALKTGEVHTLNDLRRDLRLGMGPCQGGFCAYRAAGLCQDHMHNTASETTALLSEFVERRFGGVRPLLWGQNLRQALLAEHLHGRTIGLINTPLPEFGDGSRDALQRVRTEMRGESSPVQKKIVVIGAGLAGLTAALVAQSRGAQVEVVAAGQGALTLYPGWIELGDVEALAADPDHPYHHSRAALETGLAELNSVVPLYAAPQGRAITALGRFRPVAYTAGIPYPTLTDETPVRVIGFRVKGEIWRDFYPAVVADTLRTAGYSAESHLIDMPDFGGNFDNWSTDLARYLDTPKGRADLIAQLTPVVDGDGTCVLAFPAVLGLDWATKQALIEGLHVPVLEIPVLPPSIPGLRLYHALRKAILARGGRFTVGPRVSGLDVNDDGSVRGVWIETAAHGRPGWIPADAVILATGGLYGGGLTSDYQGNVIEAVANLPVAHVPSVEQWADDALMSGRGLPINRAGVSVDAALRPLRNGSPAYPNLYAAGRILAGALPVIEGSTEGIDIASGAAAALAAV